MNDKLTAVLAAVLILSITVIVIAILQAITGSLW